MGRRESRTWREKEWRGKEEKIKNHDRVESERTFYSYWNWQTFGRGENGHGSSLIFSIGLPAYIHIKKSNDNTIVQIDVLNIRLFYTKMDLWH